MKELTDKSEPPQGKTLFEELLWVHGAVRRDLDVVRRLADECVEGRPAEEVVDAVRRLETNGPLWRLKVNCLRYCAFVHSHHNAEDVMLFPMVRAESPELGSVVDRLESEHRTVSDRLDEVEASARALAAGEDEESRRRLADALTTLADELLAHLSYEEESLAPVLSRMPGL